MLKETAAMRVTRIVRLSQSHTYNSQLASYNSSFSHSMAPPYKSQSYHPQTTNLRALAKARMNATVEGKRERVNFMTTPKAFPVSTLGITLGFTLYNSPPTTATNFESFDVKRTEKKHNN